MEGFVNIGLSVADDERFHDHRYQHSISIDKYVQEVIDYAYEIYIKDPAHLRREIERHRRRNLGPITKQVIAHPTGDTHNKLISLASYHDLPVSTFVRSAIRLHLDGLQYQLDLWLNSDLKPTTTEKNALAKPAPAYIGIRNNKISLVDRDVDHDDSRGDLRSRLVVEQRRIAFWFIENRHRLQVDQRIFDHIQVYGNACGANHAQVNVFTLDDEIRVIRRGIGNDIDALGEAGSEQWTNFERNHLVLTNLYPEMNEYREALAKVDPELALPEAIASQLIAALQEPSSQEIVAPEVPARILESFDRVSYPDTEANRKRTYDVAALVTRTGGAIWQLIEILPKFERASASSYALWERYWPILRELMKKMNWL